MGIKRQRHEGWIAVDDDYDDGGFSGGHMDRPALRRLMADTQMGKVDIVVVLPMRNLAGLWQQLFPAEQCRLAQRLIERVVITDGGLEIIWRDQGWQELAGELLPGTIGAELQDWDRQEVAA